LFFKKKGNKEQALTKGGTTKYISLAHRHFFPIKKEETIFGVDSSKSNLSKGVPSPTADRRGERGSFARSDNVGYFLQANYCMERGEKRKSPYGKFNLRGEEGLCNDTQPKIRVPRKKKGKGTTSPPKEKRLNP